MIVKFNSVDNWSRTISKGYQSIFLNIIDSYFMLIAHWCSCDVSSTFWYSHITNVSLKFFSKNRFCFKSVDIPHNQTWPSTHLCSRHKSLSWIDIKTGNVIVVRSVNSHSIRFFIEDDSACSSMVDYLTLSAVADIVSGIITSVSINVTNFKIHIRNFIFWYLFSRF